MIALLTTLAFGMEAPEDPPVDPLVEARKRSTRGAVLLTAGGLAMGGGATALLLRQGEPGDVVRGGATTAVDELRSVGGAVLLMSGFVAIYAGGNELGRASALRREARSVSLLPAPGGVVLAGRF